MVRGGEGTRRGPRIDRMGGLVLAMIIGALVPPLVVSVLANRDPLPRSCATGAVSATRLDGAVLRSSGSDLWYMEGLPGQPRKLVDYTPRPARIVAGATPSPSASAPPASPSPSGSPGVAAPVPRVVAADISADRRLVALLVMDPPGHPGYVTLYLTSPLDQPAKAPVEGWTGLYARPSTQAPSVRFLDNNRVLFITQLPRATVTPPFPLVTPPPAPPPTPVPSRSPSAPASILSPSPAVSISLSPSPLSTGTVGVVVVDPPTGHPVDWATQDYFIALARRGWPDTKGYRLPLALPALSGRVDGPTARVAGIIEREVGTPLAQRRLNQVVVGTAGRPGTSVVCAAAPGMSPLAFSPDETGLGMFDGQDTWYLDLGGVHAVSRLVRGRILAWRA